MEEGIRAELERCLVVLESLLLAIGRAYANQCAHPVATILAYSRCGDPKPLISFVSRAPRAEQVR